MIWDEDEEGVGTSPKVLVSVHSVLSNNPLCPSGCGSIQSSASALPAIISAKTTAPNIASSVLGRFIPGRHCPYVSGIRTDGPFHPIPPAVPLFLRHLSLPRGEEGEVDASRFPLPCRWMMPLP